MMFVMMAVLIGCEDVTGAEYTPRERNNREIMERTVFIILSSFFFSID